VSAPLGFLEKEPVLFGSTDDGGERYFLVIGLSQTIFDVGVIVRGERDVLVLDNAFFNGEFKEQILLKGLRDSGRGGSIVLDGEMVRIFSILSHESKKPSFFNTKDLLEVFSFDLMTQIAFQEFFDLIRGKTFV
jgi:hypothetical protein